MCRGCRGVSRRPRTSPWRSGSGSARSSRRGCSARSACGRPTRTGPKLVITPETPRRRGREVRRRYTTADLSVLTRDETRRFVPRGGSDPQTDVSLAWELLYRLEPELYDRLVSAERLHPGVLGWLPQDVDRIVEVAAGTGRLTLELVRRGREILAIEPAGPLREILNQKLARADQGYRAQVSHGFFDDLPVTDACADLVVACSALTPAPEHGGEAGLA